MAEVEAAQQRRGSQIEMDAILSLKRRGSLTEESKTLGRFGAAAGSKTQLEIGGKLAYHPLRKRALTGNPNAARSKVKTFSDHENPFVVQFLQANHIDPDQFARFQKQVPTIVTPLMSGSYDNDRKEADNAFNHFPLMIVKCGSTLDVINTIRFAREQKLRVCMRAGGHNTAGYSVIDGTVLIDVTGIGGVHVDPEAMTVSVGAGVRWGQFNNELDAFGLHTVTGSCSDVGCLGYTLGGGYGYTSMKYGMACDNLIGITMVTAEGEIVIANESRHEDLLWAHRGGTGGNFGVVVGLNYRLHKLKEVYPISVNWPITDAAKLLVTWQNEMTKTLVDRDLGLLGFLAFYPSKRNVDASGRSYFTFEPYFCIRGIYSGNDPVAGAKALAPLMSIGTPTIPPGCTQLWTQTITYAEANEHLLDNTEGVIPDTIKETKRCAFVERALTEAEYQKIVDYFCTSPCEYNIMSMEPAGGAINEVASDATAYVHRTTYWDIFTDSFWNTEDEKPAAFQWLKGMYESDELRGLWSSQYYQNYPNSDYKDWEEGYFGANYPQLQEAKQKWDPDNFFTFPQAIRLPEKK
jgi:FAD/FMN-containing dehydrogenase